MRKELNQVDICFVVDTTGSMSSFINAAKKHLLKMISTLGSIAGLDWQVGLVEYRDHPPQDNSFVKRAYQLTSDLKKMEGTINKLAADGGGDAPEAVYDGLQAACKEMNWRKHSCRFVILVGDAPPHGFELVERKDDNTYVASKNTGDHWPNGCPCGLTGKSVAALAEEQRITLYAISMASCKFTLEAFAEVANCTGGQCSQSKNADDVLKQINTLLDNEFKNILFDGLVLDLVKNQPEITAQEVSDRLACPRLQAVASLARLGRRGFLEKEEIQQEIVKKREPSIDHIEPVYLLTSLINTFFPWTR
jgi:von Willebrand factor type A domain